jgi:hypothetical protein
VALPARTHPYHFSGPLMLMQSLTSSCVCWTSDKNPLLSRMPCLPHSAHVCGGGSKSSVPCFQALCTLGTRCACALCHGHTVTNRVSPIGPARLSAVLVCCELRGRFSFAFSLSPHHHGACHTLTHQSINTANNMHCMCILNLSTVEQTTLARHGTDRHTPPRVSTLPSLPLSCIEICIHPWTVAHRQ